MAMALVSLILEGRQILVCRVVTLSLSYVHPPNLPEKKKKIGY